MIKNLLFCGFLRLIINKILLKRAKLEILNRPITLHDIEKNVFLFSTWIKVKSLPSVKINILKFEN